MRGLFTSLLALGLVSGALGCNHMCGVCDCDHCNDPCCYYGYPYYLGGHEVAQPVVYEQGGQALPMPSQTLEKAKEK